LGASWCERDGSAFGTQRERYCARGAFPKHRPLARSEAAAPSPGGGQSPTPSRGRAPRQGSRGRGQRPSARARPWGRPGGGSEAEQRCRPRRGTAAESVFKCRCFIREGKSEEKREERERRGRGEGERERDASGCRVCLKTKDAGWGGGSSREVDFRLLRADGAVIPTRVGLRPMYLLAQLRLTPADIKLISAFLSHCHTERRRQRIQPNS